MDLVDLNQAKIQLRVELDNTDSDSDIGEKIHLASSIVLNKLKVEIAEPEDATAPPKACDVYAALAERFSRPVSLVEGNLTAATLLIVSELYENREASEATILSPCVLALLDPFRDPALA